MYFTVSFRFIFLKKTFFNYSRYVIQDKLNEARQQQSLISCWRPLRRLLAIDHSLLPLYIFMFYCVSGTYRNSPQTGQIGFSSSHLHCFAVDIFRFSALAIPQQPVEEINQQTMHNGFSFDEYIYVLQTLVCVCVHDV